MGQVPPGKSETETLAWPSMSGTSTLAPLGPNPPKSTLPVGTPAPGTTGLTFAVNVTAWPHAEGLGEESEMVVVVVWSTTSLVFRLEAHKVGIAEIAGLDAVRAAIQVPKRQGGGRVARLATLQRDRAQRAAGAGVPEHHLACRRAVGLAGKLHRRRVSDRLAVGFI